MLLGRTLFLRKYDTVISLSDFFVGLWEAIYTIVDHSATTIHVDDRVRFSVGLGRVLATQPDDQLLMSYLERVMSFPIFRLERLIQLSKRAQTSKLLGPLLADIGAELHIVTALSVSFSGTPHSIGMKSPLPVLKSRPDVTLRLIQRAWPSIMDVARNWTDNEVSAITEWPSMLLIFPHLNFLAKTVMMSLKDFLKDVLPHTSDDIHSVSLLHELCSLSSTAILTDSDRCRERVEVAFGFASDVLRAFGSRLDSSYFSQRNGSYDQSAKSDDVNTLVGDLIRVDVVVIAEAFGSAFPPKGLRREQMNDEDVMEQEIQTARDSLPVTSIEPLSAIMSFLEMSLEYCPLFFIQLIPMNGKNHNVWEVLQQATDVSVSSLNNRDSDDVRSAMSFLKSMVRRTNVVVFAIVKTLRYLTNILCPF